MISKQDCLKRVREIIDAVLSTVDENGNPQSRVIDIMLVDETVYFLTARGKNVYNEIEKNPHVSFLSLKDNISIRITGIAEKLDNQKQWIDKMFEENKYMNNVYPAETRYILEPFYIKKGEIEYFDLTQKPIFRTSFIIGDGEITSKGFKITEKCIHCGICEKVCPQKSILDLGEIYKIQDNHCLHCGICFENCPVNAIIRI
ncbi:MAG: 4Fe-4S dicluster domain-containing protein [Methanosphaera stadtmanae]|nr:4Fe-4S dicluster domain-containing protein [Methanosphaera stadtmanae]